MGKGIKKFVIELFAIVVCLVIYGIPFFFAIINSLKSRTEAAELSISLPKKLHFLQNYKEVLTTENYIVLRAFLNSSIITVVSVLILIFVASMTGYILQRRKEEISSIVNSLILMGLMIPPSVVPTIWILKTLGLYKTLTGMILIEVALSYPFSTLLYTNFMNTIPREIDESAIIDGCGAIQMFWKIIFPLLKPVTVTVTILNAVHIFNDFVNPLYFLPGARNATVQLTLYNFVSRYSTSWNLVFADAVLISIPPLIFFIFFNKKIVAGMTAGAIKA
ncbi:binding-protein-dependent transport systems inner membrane component [Caldicellulosiruptor hydrothermalis 108]|uniref:Binding-protein-dependent transport systems inner membrane component n=1 Tax=Caldicellulosiruptor hydrothermalis (strain DSM 18901 / VKM B-2411 / 108) TaxID=632292 RepID=E4Q7Y5_CALH1|nr:carbohydrate ABC transporter permease [Caldicellulosiruptor hydrothermalis]ADQ07903.1 binding-protein-dependent transport systems inner membrane component [Caldicellulosiruptor hydrothermalis 108]